MASVASNSVEGVVLYADLVVDQLQFLELGVVGQVNVWLGKNFRLKPFQQPLLDVDPGVAWDEEDAGVFVFWTGVAELIEAVQELSFFSAFHG